MKSHLINSSNFLQFILILLFTIFHFLYPILRYTPYLYLLTYSSCHSSDHILISSSLSSLFPRSALRSSSSVLVKVLFLHLSFHCSYILSSSFSSSQRSINECGKTSRSKEHHSIMLSCSFASLDTRALHCEKSRDSIMEGKTRYQYSISQ